MTLGSSIIPSAKADPTRTRPLEVAPLPIPKILHRAGHMRATIHNFFRYMPRTEGRAVLISVGVGVAMLAVKLVAYERTGSAAILSDALEGIVNIVASCFAAYALSTAHRPADRDHPYGHGKIEFLSAGFEGGMIVLAAVV